MEVTVFQVNPEQAGVYLQLPGGPEVVVGINFEKEMGGWVLTQDLVLNRARWGEVVIPISKHLLKRDSLSWEWEVMDEE